MRKRSFGNRLLYSVAIAAGVLLLFWYFGFEFPFRGSPFNEGRHGNTPLTPPWALECWLWEDDHNTALYVDSLLDGYAEHDIPVRTIMIDSPWSTRYNDFATDTILYPDPAKWFTSLQEKGYRVVLWMTSMVCSYSEDTRIKESEDWFGDAAGEGYLACNGKQIEWWKGKGGFIDYLNPEAMKWWHGLQEEVFSWGIDGWKLDGTATLFRTMIGPLPLFYGKSSEGMLTTRKYMDHYYRNEYAYGLSRNEEFVTLGRSIDRWYHPEGFAPVDAAPVTWVGDQEHSWETEPGNDNGADVALEGIQGIRSAMESILSAAKLGYNIIGSDIGGFSGQVIPPGLYIRWAQFSSFCGLFLNGGHGERALWKRSQEELEIIRKFSWLHTELIPYMYSYVVEAHKGGDVLQRPVGKDYHYMFGDWLLVAPIYRDDMKREVVLPEGKWRYFFNDTIAYTGPAKFEQEFPLDEYPVFVHEGAIIPLDVKRHYTGLGDTASEGYLTLLIYPESKSSFTLYHPDRSGSVLISVEMTEGQIRISIEGVVKPHILRINMETRPSKIFLNGKEISAESWFYDDVKNKLVIRTDSTQNQVYSIDF